MCELYTRHLGLTSITRLRYSGSSSASTEKKSSVLNRFGSVGRSVPGLAEPLPSRLIPCSQRLVTPERDSVFKVQKLVHFYVP